MMELSHSLVLNEAALGQIAESKRPVFVFEWLRFLDKVLVAAQKSDIKGCQQKLVEQLTNQMTQLPGPPTRKLLARCLATLFSVGDPFSLFETINKCNDILKNKDDSPSYLPTRLSAIASIGAMYEKLGRMVGRSFEETVQVFIKSLKNAESQGRCEIMLTLQKIVLGMGSVASSVHKDIYKAARNCMTDRVMSVRCAAAKCLQELVKEAPFLYTTELENMASLCFRAFDGSNYDVRCAVADLLGNLLASAVTPKPIVGRFKVATTEEILNILATGFLRGGIGFLKGGAGEMIKGAGVSREVRVGVTHSYVVFVQTLGGLWLERNASLFLNHVLELVANPRALTTHVDAVYSRKCVSFILRSIFGSMLGEKAQISTCRELCQTILRQMRLLDSAPEHASNGKDGNFELSTSQHILISALQELGSLVQGLGTIAGPLVAEPNNNIIDPVFSVLIHPSPAARFAAAWCLRCIAVAVPSQLTPLLERCIDRLESLKSSPEAISGYSAALAALVGGVCQCPLGIPHAKGKQIFNIAEDLLRTASQSSRLSIQRTQAGWLLLGAFMTLGPPVVRSQVPRLLLLWKNAFPRSTKELESEKARGDAFTWQVTLEGRAGALSAMHSFVSHCQELVTEDVIRRLLSPIEAALLMLANTSCVIKSYGQHLKAGAATVRLRLYQTLSRLPPETFEGSYSSLLRELVAEFTLTENPANTTTSLLRSMCHQDDSVILGSWLQETDHKAVEDQLQPNSASGSGALEHDPATLYTRLAWGETIPGPLPLGVAVIDSSVALYGQIFPRVAYKHRLQMLEHFAECIKQTKSSRQQAVQINIFTAVLSALKCLAETKTTFGQNDIRRAANNLVMGALTNSNPILRCAAGEALGRMAQVVGDSRFTAEMAQYSFDRLKSARDVVSRTGHSLALGCLHRYVGGMCSGQHLNTSVSILLALAQDTTSPIVQVWALHALALIADSGGPMFRGYFEPTLSLALKLLLNVSPANIDVHQCIAKCLSALITTVGPELQGNTGALCTARSSFLVACAIMQDHTDSLVQAEAITCLQQLHMFAPRHVNLSTLVPHLCRTLSSSHLLLRRAAVACLRQLSQREAREVCDHALTLVSENKDRTDLGFTITESGLPGILFGMLDTETDRKLSSDIHDTLTSMLQSLAGEHLQQWMTLCKDVLATSTDASSTPDENTQDTCENIDDDDVAKFHAGEEIVTHPTVAPRWPTRVFAIECVQKILTVCDSNKTHFDLVLAREKKFSSGKVDFLVLHLSDLVRMAFMAATSDSDQLRLAGLTALQEIINKFAKVPEPEFPGHVILEQFQAQVGAALRPAFSADTPSHVTAMACQVCSSWIGSGVARDLNDLRRVHQLLVSSLTKLKKGTQAAQLFSESASTLEKLSILKAWAEVYIVAMQRQTEETNGENDSESENLLSLVSPELISLSKHWLASLKDHALLSLPIEFSSQLPPEGGAFYSVETIETARPYYRCSWPPILYAASLWLNNGGFENISDEKEEVNVSGSTNLGLGAVNAASSKNPEEINTDRFHLIFGICMEALCSPRAEEPVECVTLCLQSQYKLLDSVWSRSQLGRDPELSVELLNVLHRLLLTRELPAVQLLVMEVVKQVIKSAHENLELQKKQLLKESVPANQEPKESDLVDTIVGEGGENGEIIPGKSIVFASLEICLCVLIRQLPILNPVLPAVQSSSKAICLTNDALQLISLAVAIMADLPSLCSPVGSVSVLPSILYLTTGVLREMAQRMVDLPSCNNAVSTTLHSLRTLAASPFTRDSRCSEDWIKFLQSTLAAILDISKTGSEDNKIDDVSMMLAVAVFIISAPWQVTSVINLQYPCINMFKRLVQSEKTAVQFKCLQTLRSIFQHPDRIISTPYIHALAPRIIESLHTQVTCQAPSDIANVTERVQIMETLVSLSEDCNKIHLMSLLVPLLISFLQDASSSSSSHQTSSGLHDFALQQLMKIGPKYPQQFRQIMTSCPDLRSRLETAVRANQAGSKTSSHPDPIPTLHVPTIKLKMDFVANFTG